MHEIRRRLAWGLVTIAGVGLVTMALVYPGEVSLLLTAGGSLLLGAGLVGGLIDERGRRHVARVRQQLRPLHESEERYRRLVEQSPDPITVHQDGKIVYLNPSGIALIGAEDASQIIGQSVMPFVHPEYRAQVRRRIGLIRQGQDTELAEEKLIRLDGTVIDVEATAMPVTYEGAPAVQVMLRDITERKRTERALQESEDKFSRAFRAAPVAISISTVDEGRFVDVNDRFAEVLGYDDAGDIIGRTSGEIGMWVDLDAHRKMLDLDEEPYEEAHHGEGQVRTRQGDIRDVIVSVERAEFGGTTCLLSMLLDVTERKQYERHLEEAKEQAEDLARLKTAFLANMSHEIRTPLTGIIGFASVLDDEVSDKHREITTLIRHSGERLMDTLNSVLDLARLEAGALEISPEPLDLKHEIEDTVRLFRTRAEQKDVALLTDLPPEDVHAHLDRAALHRVLSNLLSNAIKFTNEGHVTVGLTHSGDKVRLHVEDTGVGISEDFLPYLFDEFKQESTGVARSYTGSGLGLSITRRLVERMNGIIEVESTKGAGTRFSLCFPSYRPTPATT